MDLKKLGEEHCIDHITVFPSTGSVQNLVAVAERKGVQLGFAQSDVLEVLTYQSDRKLRHLATKLRLVGPLHSEDVHIIASHASNITTFADLENKRVALGKRGSGTLQTAQILLRRAGLRPKTVLEIGDNEALQALIQGEIDVMFDVAGVPNTLLQRSLAQDAPVRLVPLTEQVIQGLTDLYTPSLIRQDTYVWNKHDVATVSTRAVLFTFDYQNEHEPCRYVGRMAKMLYDHLEWLRKNGHPKWRDVDLDRPVPSWERSRCVTQALDGSAQPGKKSLSSGPKR